MTFFDFSTFSGQYLEIDEKSSIAMYKIITSTLVDVHIKCFNASSTPLLIVLELIMI